MPMSLVFTTVATPVSVLVAVTSAPRHRSSLGVLDGLSRVKDGVFTTLTSSNGLPCDAINSLIEDNDHSFWLYMACGIVRIARSELDAWVSDSKLSVQTTL